MQSSRENIEISAWKSLFYSCMLYDVYDISFNSYNYRSFKLLVYKKKYF